MVQYKTSVDWDVTLIDLQYTDIDNAIVKGLVCFAVKITTGAPTATAGKFIPGAIIANGVSGVLYVNTGTTASPVWSVIDSNTSGLPALANGKIWAGNGSNVATAVTPSGDVTITNAGVMAIGAGKVLLAMLGAGIAPAYVSKFGGKTTWTGSGATKQASVAGVLATDIVIATIQTKPTQAAYLVRATPGTDTIDFELSAANTSNDAVIAWQVFRVAA